MGLRYHFVELSTVTDDAIEGAVNEAVSDGWNFEGLHFAMREASKRPAMVFIAFTRETPDGGDDEYGGG